MIVQENRKVLHVFICGGEHAAQAGILNSPFNSARAVAVWCSAFFMIFDV